MADSTTEDQSSGSSLRDKLEAALATNKALHSQLATAVAGGFKFVKPEDLAEVDPTQFAAKAQEIEAARTTQAEEFARKLLADKFGPDVDLDSILPKAEAQPQPDSGAADRLASLGQLGGVPVTTRPETDGSARGDILAGLTD